MYKFIPKLASPANSLNLRNALLRRLRENKPALPNQNQLTALNFPVRHNRLVRETLLKRNNEQSSKRNRRKRENCNEAAREKGR